MPEKFVDWIYWKLGDKIAKDYMIPYNQKMFGKELDELGTYWLDKLPNVSFEETLLSCLEKKPYGKDPGHSRFYYPKKYGYGELWLRMAEALGDRIIYGASVSGIDYENKTVKLESGEGYKADVIVSTIPWNEYRETIAMPDELRQKIGRLKHSSIQVEYHEENLDTDSQWIYYPDPELSYHRILVRPNFGPGSRGYWSETNAERIESNEQNSG